MNVSISAHEDGARPRPRPALDRPEFSVPWVQLGLLVTLTFVASLLATLAPAQQASHIRPAVALRLAD